MTVNTTHEKVARNMRAKQIALDEFALWQDFRNGDVEAYAAIYRKYFFVLFSYGKKLNSDHELVKDCIQELFIKIWNNRKNLSETTTIKYYLFTALKRKLLDAVRKPSMEVQMDEAHEADFLLEFPDSTTQEDGHAQKENVLKALNRLSDHQQKILDMKFQKNLSNKEIADELGIGIQSVYNAVFKALRSIRKHLAMISIVKCFVMLF